MKRGAARFSRRRIDPRPITGRETLGELYEVVDGYDVPQGGVYRIEFRRLAVVREPVGQHAVGHRAGPFEEDGACVVQAPRREAQAAKGDERVPPPIGEPGVPGDDGLPATRAPPAGTERRSCPAVPIPTRRRPAARQRSAHEAGGE